jgi:DNA-binding transcriptional ArsR family regulator
MQENTINLVGAKMSLKELIIERSKKCELFSNPLRCFIIAFIASKNEVTWSQLKKALETWIGYVNPNTLSFHLGELMEGGFIIKIDIEGQPRYKIVENRLPEIQRLVGEDLIKKMEEA